MQPVQSWREKAGNPVVRAADRGVPWLGFQDGLAVPAAPAKSLATDAAFAAASADFDGDGVRDLVAGYAGPEGGVVTIARGNVDAIYPNAPEAQARKAAGTFTDAPFLAGTRAFAVPGAAELVGAGDFDADGRMDVVAAKIGDTGLYWLRGDGDGNLETARRIEVDGKVTALTVGEIDAADGLDDVAVGVSGKGSARILVFKARNGAFNAAPEEIAAPGTVTSLATGQLDDTYTMDLAAAAGGRLVVVHGKSDLSPKAVYAGETPAVRRVETLDAGFRVASLASGNFLGDGRLELAVASKNGDLAVWQHGVASVRPWGSGAISNGAATLVRSKSSMAAHDDLVVVDTASRRLRVLLGDAGETSKADAPRIDTASEPVDLEVDGEPVAVVAMRLNVDARADLVVLTRGGATPAVVTTVQGGTFTVNTTADAPDSNVGDGNCDDGMGNCTLRAAIEEASAFSGAGTINFAIGSGAQTIEPGSSLPSIGNGVVIDGTSQPGFAGTPLITVSGIGAGGPPPSQRGFVGGFLITGSSSVIRSLVINNWSGQGILLATFSASNTIEGNYIGTDSAGTAAAGNAVHGIEIFSSSDNTVGGSTAAARNVISGNSEQGIRLEGQGQSAAAADNLIRGNFIGTNAAGTGAISNGFNGIEMAEADNTNVGGSGAGEGNVISGNDMNGANGVRVEFNTFGVLIQGNAIGVSVGGGMDLGNGGHGVSNAGFGTLIGGAGGSGKNVISGNAMSGIRAGGINLDIFGNHIGTNAAGSAAIANGAYAIDGFGADADIGSTSPGDANVISGNGVHGIFLTGDPKGGSAVAFIIGNKIGVGANGMTLIGNGGDGVFAEDFSISIIEDNLIAGNVNGVQVFSNGEANINRNLIHSNSALGIELGGDGPTANDVGDADMGPNRLLNFPVVTSAVFDAGNLTIDGSIDTDLSNVNVVVEVFVNPSCDSSGFGEGRQFAGSFEVAVNGSGDAVFSESFPPGVTINSGDVVSTTATWLDPGKKIAAPRGVFPIETSEFSACVAISVPVTPMADLSLTADGAPNPVDAGQNITYSYTVTNNGPNDAPATVFQTSVPANTTFVSFNAPAGWMVEAPMPGGTGTITASNTLTVAAGAQNFTLVVAVDSGASPGTVITNTSSVMSSLSDPTPSNNNATVNVTVAGNGNSDVAITKTADRLDPLPGDDVTYTVTVTNNGPDAAVSLTLEDDIPAGTTFRALRGPTGGGPPGRGGPTTWNCTAPPTGDTGQITCTTPTLANGESSVFTIVVRVDQTAAANDVITNTATVTVAGTTDSNQNNNSASAVVTVGAVPLADLSITTTVLPANPSPGSTVTITATATNNGPSDTPNLSISVPLPTDVLFISATPDAGGTVTAPAAGTSGTVTVTWAAVTTVGQSRTVTITGQVSPNAVDETAITVTATASSGLPDIDPSNNSSSADFVVTLDENAPKADISVTVNDVPGSIDTGTLFDYVFVVTNNGPDEATNVIFSGSTPQGTRFVAISATPSRGPGGSCTTPPVGGIGAFSCNLGDIAAGASVTVTVTVNIVAPGGDVLSLSAVTSSDVNDPNPNNNATTSSQSNVRAGLDTELRWDPPLPCPDDCLNPPLHLQSFTASAKQGTRVTGRLANLVRDTRNTVIGYNIYRSNNPNVSSTPANFFTSVPPNVTTIVVPTAPGGSFFTVTATYPNGESGGTNAASGGIPEPQITGFEIRGNQVLVFGTGFTDTVQVFVDGIPFKKAAKVKDRNGSIRVVQKGKLLTGQKVSTYLTGQGNVILVSVLNTDTGIGTFLYRE